MNKNRSFYDKNWKSLIEDAKILLEVQKNAFKKYALKYGDFDSNPYNMSLHRMEFNIKYRFGQYYKVIDEENGEIIGAGDHDYLLSNCAEYKEISDSQMGGAFVE